MAEIFAMVSNVAKIELNPFRVFAVDCIFVLKIVTTMLQQYLAQQFESALLQLKNEINSYTHKENIWEVHGEIKNSGGTLVLHLLGNLNHFIGATLGNSGYVRNREAEFSERNISSSAMMKSTDELMYRVKEIVGNLTEAQLFGEYPLKDGKPAKITVERLVQLLAHLHYHLGQLNYHRRLLEQPVSLPDGVDRLEKRNPVMQPYNQ